MLGMRRCSVREEQEVAVSVWRVVVQQSTGQGQALVVVVLVVAEGALRIGGIHC